MASVQVSSHLKRLGTGDPTTVWVEGVKKTAALMVVERFRYTVQCEGNAKILPWQSVVVDEEESGKEEEEDLAKEEKEEEEPKVQAQLKRRRKRKHSEVDNAHYKHFSYFYQRPVLVFRYCRCCVCRRLCVSVCQSLACLHDNSGPIQARITKIWVKGAKQLG